MHSFRNCFTSTDHGNGSRSFIECLEARRFLDGTVSLTSRGTLGASGDAGDNVIVVSIAGSVATVTCDGQSMNFDAARVRRIRVEAGDGADHVTINAHLNAAVFGEAGNDTLIGGTGEDSLGGGLGDDVLDGRASSDELAGGSGFDTADYSTRESRFAFEVETPGESVPSTEDAGFALAFGSGGEVDDIGFFVERILGTNHSDHFEVGVTFSDERVLDGRAGHDQFTHRFTQNDAKIVLIGGSGNDEIYCAFRQAFGGGSATVLGGAGDDTIVPTHGFGIGERIEGASGHDVIDLREYGNPESRLLFTTDPSDQLDMRAYAGIEDVTGIGVHLSMTVIGNNSPNRMTRGGSNRFRLFGLGGDDTLEGGNDRDALFGGDGDDVILGGGGRDTLRGENGNDTISGGGGGDRLYGHGGNDSLHGGAGVDRLYGSSGVDTFIAGDGNDELFARDSIAEVLNGDAGVDGAQADEGLDVLFSVEIILP